MVLFNLFYTNKIDDPCIGGPPIWEQWGFDPSLYRGVNLGLGTAGATNWIDDGKSSIYIAR